MANPPIIVLDTNVLLHIAQGSQPAADALKRFGSGGTTIYISQAAYNEFLDDAPNSFERGSRKAFLEDARIKTAPSGTMADRVTVLADNIQYKPGKNKPGQIDEYNQRGTPGDAFVAAQSKAIGAKLWTMDHRTAKRCIAQGIPVVDEWKLPGGSGPTNWQRARQMIGIPARGIGPDGNPTKAVPPPSPPPKPPAGGTGGKPGGGSPAAGKGPGGTTATTGVADNRLPEFVGPSARGQAMVGGIQLLFQGLNIALNYAGERIRREEIRKALDAIDAQVSAARSNPRMGVLLILYFRQIIAPQESLIQPGPVFGHVIWGKGLTQDEARIDANRTPQIYQGPGPGEKILTQECWIPPQNPAAPSEFKLPFPAVAIARFYTGNGSDAVFQLVKFDVLGGFDDIVEKKVPIGTGVGPSFLVLQPPPQVSWYNQNGRQTTSVSLRTEKTANGNDVKVVDLDTWSPFSARAAPVFPIDAAGREFFGRVQSTDGIQVLSLINAGMIRWVRAPNIHLLQFL